MTAEGICFGRWRLLPRTRTLVADGERILLGGRAADILLALIEAGGAVVDRDTLVSRTWPGRVVDERNLGVQIAGLRKAFGAEGAAIVVTVPGHGYRFGATLTAQPAATPVKLVASRGADAETPTRGPSLAVMPFRTTGSDPEQADIADGIVDDLITALSHVRWYFVLGRSSTFGFKGRDLPAPELGRELGVRYVVTGSVRRTGARLRVHVEMVRTADGGAVWSDRFDHASDDLFALQDGIVGSIMGALDPGLRRAEMERLSQRPTELPRAYQAYLRGLARLYPVTRENCAATLGFLDEALALDPGFALAQATAALCRALRLSVDFSLNATAEAGTAIRLAEAALAQAPDDPLILARVGAVFTYLNYRRDAALRLVKRAIELHPNSAMTRGVAGWACLYGNDPEAAIVHLEEVFRLDPLNPAIPMLVSAMSYAHLLAGRPDAAVRWGERAIAAGPEQLGHRAYVAALGAAGQPADAAVAQLLAVDPDFNIADFRARNQPEDSPLWQCVRDGLRRAGVPEGPTPAARPALRVVQGG